MEAIPMRDTSGTIIGSQYYTSEEFSGRASQADSHDPFEFDPDNPNNMSTLTTTRSGRGWSLVEPPPLPPQHTRWALLANRIMYTRWYSALYIIMLLINLALLIWGIVHHRFLSSRGRDDVWFVAIDVVLSIIFALEVLLRLVAKQAAFWRSWMNVADFVVMLVCIVGLFLYIFHPEAAIFGSGVLFFRYLIQLVRVGFLYKFHKHRKKVINAREEKISFDDDEFADDDEDDDDNLLEDHGYTMMSAYDSQTYEYD